jgi:endonuclease/exonuclease/phosphatase family metal-dependent hydrolase
MTKILSAYKSRAQEVHRILYHAKKSPYPVIICGDFNDTPVSYCYQQLKSSFEDAFLEAGIGTGATYAGKVPPNRIDYIFHSDGFRATAFHIQKEILSDHRAIWTKLTY